MTLAVYVHWPFCISKCPYCDFNSHVGDTANQDAWRQAYRQEISTYGQRLPGRKVTSIFFGGGTPSLMQPATVAVVLETIAEAWEIDPNVEVTLEANPSSVEAQKFAVFKNIGITRLSIGIQSLRDKTLKFLGRAHDKSEGIAAIKIAAKLFPRYSFDLIYAHKDQTLAQWETELGEALELAGDHLSLYQLTIEPNTQFHTRARRGETLTSVDDEASNMYEATQEIMDKAGLPAYEVSNHARVGQESRHNMAYWKYDEYVGIGPGAHGRFCDTDGRHATEAHKAPEAWLAQVAKSGHGLKTDDLVDSDRAKQEALMMGLRTTQGIDLAAWRLKFDAPLLTSLAPGRLSRLSLEGYLTVTSERMSVTRAGMQRLNAVLAFLS